MGIKWISRWIIIHVSIPSTAVGFLCTTDLDIGTHDVEGQYMDRQEQLRAAKSRMVLISATAGTTHNFLS